MRIVAINVFLIEYMLTRQEERSLQKCYRAVLSPKSLDQEKRKIGGIKVSYLRYILK